MNDKSSDSFLLYLIVMAIILFFVFSSDKLAAGERINFGYKSYHFDRTEEVYDEVNGWHEVKKEWNENNNGIGLEFNGYGLQRYKNSYFNESYNLYKFWAVPFGEGDYRVEAGIQIGVVSGYDANPYRGSSVFPYATPRVDVILDRLTLSVLAIPNGGVAGMMQINLWK
jgi:hypothetical protein